MRYTGPGRKEWQIIHMLAGELARLRVSPNLVAGLQEYLRRHRTASPSDHLRRLVRVGGAFAGGQDELRQRNVLRAVVARFEQMVPGLDWPHLLAWTTRLMVAYRPEEPESRANERAIAERIREEMESDLELLEEAYYG